MAAVSFSPRELWSFDTSSGVVLSNQHDRVELEARPPIGLRMHQVACCRLQRNPIPCGVSLSRPLLPASAGLTRIFFRR